MTEGERVILAENLTTVRARIAAACRKVGRAADPVVLVAATKYVGLAVVEALQSLGQLDFGESRPQALWDKAGRIAGPARWHLIGPLQTNKVRRTVPLTSLIHSLDRVSLAEALSEESLRSGRRTAAAVEVNISGEASKSGFSLEALPAEFLRLCGLPGLEVVGLMGMAAEADDTEQARPAFRTLRLLRDELNERFPQQPPLKFLSMGMSGDFETAIEEGATHVRIGSALFAGLSHLESRR